MPTIRYEVLTVDRATAKELEWELNRLQQEAPHLILQQILPDKVGHGWLLVYRAEA